MEYEEKSAFILFCALNEKEIDRNAEVDVELLEEVQAAPAVDKFLRIAEVMWNQPKYADKRKSCEDTSFRCDRLIDRLQEQDYIAELQQGTQTVVSIDKANNLGAIVVRYQGPRPL